MRAPILIIEDDLTLRSLLSDWLEAVFPHHPVIAASDSRDGVALVEESAPCVILVGLDAPAADGIELIRRAKRAAPGAGVAALSVEDHQALRDDVRAAGGTCVGVWDTSDRLLPLLRRWLEAGAAQPVSMGPAVLQAVGRAPDQATLVAGECVTFTLTAEDAHGNAFDITDYEGATFDIEEGAGGIWTANVYCSEVAGEWTVTATYEGLDATAALPVVAVPVDEYQIFLPIVAAQVDEYHILLPIVVSNYAP